MTLLEVAMFARTRQRHQPRPEELFATLRTTPAVQILPISVDVAAEVAAIIHALDDPADRAIVATARVHGLDLLTSDERIVDSGLVRTID
jgi:PIN domain nuclease of toxin-antitoxin system